jgi:hypothetical protein
LFTLASHKLIKISCHQLISCSHWQSNQKAGDPPQKKFEKMSKAPDEHGLSVVEAINYLTSSKKYYVDPLTLSTWTEEEGGVRPIIQGSLSQLK